MGTVSKEEVAGKEGSGVDVYRLERGHLAVKVTNVGAAIMSLTVPDAEGEVDDIVLGFDSLIPYLDGTSPYFGCIVGRVANRIADAEFTLDGVRYKLPANNGPNTLHGGEKGFDKVLWQSKVVDNPKGPSVQFTYQSHDGEQGFPGDLDVTVTYTLIADNELETRMEASPRTKATPINLAQHTYWNLGGHGSGDVLEHEIQIFGDHITPVNENLIPTGEIKPVAGTPFDFTQSQVIGSRIHQVLGGYDHNYVLWKGKDSSEVDLAARVKHIKSGRVLEVLTSEPGVQFYTGNFLDGIAGKSGTVYNIHAGLCLETQHFPDAVNQPSFPSIIVQPGETYKHVMIFRFFSGDEGTSSVCTCPSLSKSTS